MKSKLKNISSNMDIAFFKEKFSRIKVDDWCEGMVSLGMSKDVFGHCGVITDDSLTDGANDLISIFANYFGDNFTAILALITINDGLDWAADLGFNPRDRMIAALDEIESYLANERAA